MFTYDVTGIGNAIVDVLAHCDEQFLIDNNIEKGAMTLIDTQRASELYASMKNAVEVSGGSCANTMAGLASFGGKGAYIGVVGMDSLGDIFAHDIGTLGLTYNTSRYFGPLETARCYIFITPDGERSMNTYLGACTELTIEHVDRILIQNSAVTHMEGYLFDKDPAKEAYFMAAKYARESDREVSLALSDSFCVERHKEDFQQLVKGNIDILFGNERELMALFEVETADEAMKIAAETCKAVISTRGADGVVIAAQGQETFVPAPKIDKVVDSTGAGDQLGAGFLYGYTRGMDIEKCGQLGVKAAAEVISHIGPRPQMDYKDFLND